MCQSLASNGRENAGIEIGAEPSVADTLDPSPPESPPAEEAFPYQPSSNNNFMARNVRVREWRSFLPDDARSGADQK